MEAFNTFESLRADHRALVEEMGGKNGTLLYIRDSIKGGAEYVANQVFLRPGDSFTGAHMQEITRYCRESGGFQEVAIRFGDIGDWEGMIGVEPTRLDVPVHLISKNITEMRKEIRRAALRNYAKKEGYDLDPEKFSISIAPMLFEERIMTLTEHPHDDDVQLIDGSQSYYGSYNAVNGEIQTVEMALSGSSSVQNFAAPMLQLRNAIREMGFLPDNHALQYEGGTSASSAILTQIRFFAEKVRRTFSLDHSLDHFLSRHRVFGYNFPEGIELPIYSPLDVHEPNKFEKKTPGVPYLFAPEVITGDLGFEYPEHMMGWFPGKDERVKPQLTHQNTRFVQMCLKRGGFAILGEKGPSSFLGEDAKKGKFTVDGSAFLVEST